jgi:predicted ATPase/class 3 adenylate cyclase
MTAWISARPPEGLSHLTSIHQDASTVVYRALRGQQWVVVKELRGQRPSALRLARYRQEYDITSQLSHPGVVRALALHEVGQSLAIEFEDIGAPDLHSAIAQEQITLTDALSVARSVADALAYLHQHKIIHRDINPSNILWRADTGRAQLIDFGLATHHRRMSAPPSPNQPIEGSLAYIAPEQTGRINRLVDHRADLYSLGVTLFELLTGQVPFRTDDMMGLIHAHIATPPPHPSTLNPRVPPIVDEIVLRLMAKSADERYQSALGVSHDLGRCVELLGTSDRGARTGLYAPSPPFKIGLADLSNTLLPPSHLIGRDDEVEALLSAFERVEQGGVELLLVSGYSGVGKSVLVHEVQRPITRANGLFLTGKFDQLQRASFSALTQPLQQLVDFALAQPSEQQAPLARRLSERLGPDASLLATLTHSLGALLGELPPTAHLSGAEAQHRLHRAYGSALAAFACAERPLVLFLDDLQWADPASLKLIEALITSEALSHTLIVGAYRDHEVEEGSALLSLPDRLCALGARAALMRLKPLSRAHVEQYVREALHIEAQDPQMGAALSALSAKLYEKTEGNPFFVMQLLYSLHEAEILTFNLDTLRWEWDLKTVEERGFTEHVIELLTRRLARAPEETRRALFTAACIGNTFSVPLLTEVLCVGPEAAVAALSPAIELGLLISVDLGELKALSEVDSLITHQPLESPLRGGPRCRFAHDRVQQAAVSLGSPQDISEQHCAIARVLLRSDLSDDDLLTATPHLALGAPALSEAQERLEWAKRLLVAARRALEISASSVAYDAARAAHALLSMGECHTPELRFEVTLTAAETASLVGDFDQADALHDEAERRVMSRVDEARAGAARLDQLLLQGRFAEGVTLARRCLARLEIDLPNASEEAIERTEALHKRVAELLAGRHPSALAEVPINRSPEHTATLKLLYGGFLSAYLSGAGPVALLMLGQMALTSMERGHGPLSAYGYVGYGMLLAISERDFALSHAFGELGVELGEWVDDVANRCRTHFLLAADVWNWTGPIREGRRFYERAYELAQQCGDVVTLGYVAMQSGSDQLTAGVQLDALEVWLSAQLDLLKRRGNDEACEVIRAGVYQYVLQLLGKTPWESISDAHFNEAAYLEAFREDGFHLAWLYAGGLRAVWLRGADEEYAAWAPRVEVIERSVPSHSKVPEASMFAALMRVHLALSARRGSREREAEAHLSEARRLRGRLARWAEACPANVSHRLSLIDAELALYADDRRAAGQHYERAIEEAQRHDYPNMEAIAYERYALAQRAWGVSGSSHALLREAARHYERWGAIAKVNALYKLYPDVFGVNVNLSFSRNFSGSTTVRVGDQIDTYTLVRAAEAIAQEISLEPMLRRLLETALIHSGAQRAVLVASGAQKQWLVLAEATTEGFTRHDLPLDSSEAAALIPQGLARLTLKRGEALRIEDALRDPSFERDPCVEQRGVRAILSLPLRSGNTQRGALYLEHCGTPSAFRLEHATLLEHLSTQMAIALTNALLYERLEEARRALEQRVEERTRELQNTLNELGASYERSERLLLNILPASVAQRLKSGAEQIADRYEEATVLFADLVGFTALAASQSAQETVRLLSDIFSSFDSAVGTYGLEKIKTIGDAYMVAGGVPTPIGDHTERVLHFALEMLRRIELYNERTGAQLRLRIGVHRGPLVAGVIGAQKFTYDIWGDTVNVASRMESTGEAGRIHVSEVVALATSASFEFERRGLVSVKGRGEMVTYFLQRPKG